jgi:hypothetical protein
MTVKQHVFISKTIWVIIGIILLINFGSEFEIKFIKNGYHIFNKIFQSYPFDIFDIFMFLISIIYFIVPIFLQIKALWCILFTPNVNNFNIISPSHNFHPFYFWYGRWGANYNLISSSIRSDTFLILVCIPTIFTLGIIFDKDFASHFLIRGSILFAFTLLISFYILTITSYRKNYKYFPTFILKKADRIIIETEYINFQKENSEFPLPHLKEGQEFACKLMEMPRNEKEKNTVFIFNPNHPEKNYLVTKIEDSGLCDLIRNENNLKASLHKIEDNAVLQIKLWIENKHEISEFDYEKRLV